MCDWQAVNVAPLLWDFTYATTLGLRFAERRAWQPRLLGEFLDGLRASGVDAAHLDIERALLQTQLLALVLAYVSLAVLDNGLWSGQGNVREDGDAWLRRVLAAGADADAPSISRALHLPEEDVGRLQDYFRGRRA